MAARNPASPTPTDPAAAAVGEQRVVVRASGSGPATWAMGSLFEHLLRGDETNGALGVSLVTQPPGIATPLHVHAKEGEAFYLLEGTMLYQAGDELVRLGGGDFIYLPRAVPHAFRTTGRSPVRYLALTTPGGLMGLYDEVGVPARERRLPAGDGRPLDEELGRWNEVGPRYGLSVVGPPISADLDVTAS